VLVVEHEMTAGEAVEILKTLAEHDVDVCVGGGWAVDALAGRQTRVHGDLGLWVPATCFDRAILAFVQLGIDRLFPRGDDRPWNFVLHDSDVRRLDLHLFEESPEGSLHYGGVRGDQFPRAALAGVGLIEGQTISCESPEWSLRWHRGYARVTRIDTTSSCSAPPSGSNFPTSSHESWRFRHVGGPRERYQVTARRDTTALQNDSSHAACESGTNDASALTNSTRRP
jgi:lincosamide nucleotidyltransferase A/C/D/E